jgi:hypothetical protein
MPITIAGAGACKKEQFRTDTKSKIAKLGIPKIFCIVTTKWEKREIKSHVYYNRDHETLQSNCTFHQRSLH